MVMSLSVEIKELLNEAKFLAKKYRDLTGKPLGITSEIAEFNAAHLFGLELAKARQPGYDAIQRKGRKEKRIQIKARCILPGAKLGQRVPSIKLTGEWEVVWLVLMDENFDVTSIYEAERSPIEKALKAPGSRARNERGALSVSKFRSIGRLIWECKAK
jgi:hypothetical protein